MAIVALSQANNGETVKVRPGDQITVRLPENATTGYRWHIERAEGLTEEQTAASDPSAPSPTSAPDEPNPTMGRGGLREFHFRTPEEGQGRLSLKYYREWEGPDSALENFAVNLDLVSPDAPR
ncbi:MAG TPA: protease inhibitor I42 family protein [Pyrinomonadaceae bacterium]|nr:protease inhibitor I42 family protein [Pyrinomonadaceae bacterium]